MESIQDRVIRVIADVVSIDRETIKCNSTFEKLGVESLDVVQVVFALEEEFDVHFPDEFDMGVIDSVESAVSYLSQLVPQDNAFGNGAVNEHSDAGSTLVR